MKAGGATSPTEPKGFDMSPFTKVRAPPTKGGFSCAIVSVLKVS